MVTMREAIRQLFCRHEWALHRELGLRGPSIYLCVKCGHSRTLERK
jgi:hypothetical protein